METLKKIIEEKYYWREDFQLMMSWAEKAEGEGVDPILLVDFVASKLFQKAA